MNLIWTVISVIFQLGTAYMLAMGAIFAGCSLPQSGYRLRQVDNIIISSSFYLLPVSCILVLILIIRFHRAGGSAHYYLLNLAPFLLVISYIIYARTFIPRNETPCSEMLEEYQEGESPFDE